VECIQLPSVVLSTTMVTFVVLVDFRNFGASAQNFCNTNFGLNSNSLSFFIH
jgi:hypothetical protein